MYYGSKDIKINAFKHCNAYDITYFELKTHTVSR